MAIRLIGLGYATAMGAWSTMLVVSCTRVRRPPAPVVVAAVAAGLVVAPWSVVTKVALAAGGMAGGLVAAVQIERFNLGRSRRREPTWLLRPVLRWRVHHERSAKIDHRQVEVEIAVPHHAISNGQPGVTTATRFSLGTVPDVGLTGRAWSGPPGPRS